jgi:tetratricopeptide (TPR) repeat protein
MIAKELPKVVEIIKALQPYMDQRLELDQFTLQRYKRDIRDNIMVDPWSGYLALGMIAVLEGDDDALDAAYGNALAISNDSLTHANYANALQIVGRFNEAFEHSVIASDKDPTNLTQLEQAINFSRHAGRFTVGKELIQRYSLRAPGKSLKSEGLIMDALSIFENSDLSEDTVSKCNHIAFALLRRHKIHYFSTKLRTDTQDNYLMFYIYVFATDEQVAKLDEELGIELFDSVPEYHPDRYWVGFERETDIS